MNMKDDLTTLVRQAARGGLRMDRIIISEKAAEELAAEIADANPAGDGWMSLLAKMKEGEQKFMGLPICVAADGAIL